MRLAALLPILTLMTSCSETPIEEQGAEAMAELEKQIEEDAQSLEEAANEAVSALEQEITEELEADGISVTDPPPAQDSDN